MDVANPTPSKNPFASAALLLLKTPGCNLDESYARH